MGVPQTPGNKTANSKAIECRKPETLSKPVYTHTNIPIHWTRNQSPSRECHLRAMECPNVHIISPQVVALLFYANEYLLTVNEHYERIPTHTKDLNRYRQSGQSEPKNNGKKGLVWFYGISTIVGCLKSNPVYSYNGYRWLWKVWIDI